MTNPITEFLSTGWKGMLGKEEKPEQCECSECGNRVICEHGKEEPHAVSKGCSTCHEELHQIEEEPF